MQTATKKVAIVSKLPALAAAIQAIIAPRLAGAEFVVVDRISDVPSDAYAMASFGMPTYIPASAGTRVLSVGTRMVKDEAERKALYAIVRNPEASVEDILPELGQADEYIVVGSRQATTNRLAFAEHRAAIAEAGTAEEQLAAYKAALDFLKPLVPGLN